MLSPTKHSGGKEAKNVEVSIIMAAFNVDSFIEESVRSVIEQTYQNWELIICDDCSSDQTWQLISKQTDNRIKKIRNAQNMGASKTRNICLSHSSGTYVAVLDADDVWHSTKLASQLLLINSSQDLGLIGTNAIEIDEAGLEVGVRNFPSSNRQLLDLSFWRCPMLHSSILFRRELLAKGYREDLATTMDWALIMDLLLRSQGAVIQEPLVYYRVHDQNITHKKASEQKRNAFLVVQNKKLFRRFSKTENRIFEDFFNYNNPPKKEFLKGIKVLLMVFWKHRGYESWKRLIWFLKYLVKP